MGDAAEMMQGTALSPSGVDADQNHDSSEEVVPGRLSIGSIGGLKIRKPQDKLPSLNLMVYGESGAGKTLLAGTAAYVPELSPVLFIDVEGGTHTLSHFEESADIDIIPDAAQGGALKWKDVQKIYDELYRGRHPYKTVVIDSFTEIQKLAMNAILNGDGKMAIDAQGNLPEFRDWNINTEQIRRMARAFRDLPINTIFTALADDKVDPRTANSENPRMLKAPSFTKKLAQEIPAFFDMVFYLYSKARGQQNLRYIQTDKDNTVVAKCRVKGVPMVVENPTMDTLYDMLIRNPGEVSVPATASPSGAGGMKRR